MKKCSLRHIDSLAKPVKLLSTETLGCITGMRFFSMNSVPSCVSDDGVNLSIRTPEKVVFIAANHRNQLITLFLNVVVA